MPALHTSTIPAGFRRDLVRWRQLVAPAWLEGLLTGRAVAAAPAGRWRLIEVGCGEAACHAAGHIPGAAYIDTAELEVQPLWNKVSDQALLGVLLAKGIACDTAVILYGRNPLAAARAAHLMLYAGVADVRLLDGGLAAWRAAGLALETGAPPAVPALAAFGCAFPAHPSYLIDTSQARRLLAQPDGALVSIRSWSEFTGASSGYSYIETCGDIPGARWGRAGNDGDVNCMADYHNADGSMRAARDICAQWRENGIHPGQHAAFYCGTGWRASLAFFYAWLMDWQRISVYDGGWFEWSADPANPVARRAAVFAKAPESKRKI
jgi:3-mercaptopyruvate sulfurtransferase SseA